MGKQRSRRTPERIALGWTPFVLGAAVAVFAAGATVLMLADLLLGLVVATLLASSTRSTGRLLRLLPRLSAAVVAANGAILIALAALDRI